MLRSTSWAGAASVAWVAGVAVAAVAVLISAPGIASAQTPVPVPPSAEPGASALVAARELFREAGQDADAGKFALALEKYRRVAAVKETGQVRFNIARCEEQLGQIASALADYELVERDMHDAHGDAENELRGTSRERGNALRPRVPRLTLKGPLPQPPSFVVRLDGAIVNDAALGVPLPVDPGRHRVEASAGGHLPITRELEISEKQAITLPLELDKSAATSEVGAADSTGPSDGSGQRTAGWITFGGGVALGVASIVFAIEHNKIVGDVQNDCPNNKCPSSTTLTADNARHGGANTDAGLAVGLAVGAVAAAGTGIVLVLTAKHAPTQVAMHPGAPGAPAGASFALTF